MSYPSGRLKTVYRHVYPRKQKSEVKNTRRAGETAQQLYTLTVLPEDKSSIFSTHMMTHSHL